MRLFEDSVVNVWWDWWFTSDDMMQLATMSASRVPKCSAEQPTVSATKHTRIPRSCSVCLSGISSPGCWEATISATQTSNSSAELQCLLNIDPRVLQNNSFLYRDTCKSTLSAMHAFNGSEERQCGLSRHPSVLRNNIEGSQTFKSSAEQKCTACKDSEEQRCLPHGLPRILQNYSVS